MSEGLRGSHYLLLTVSPGQSGSLGSCLLLLNVSLETVSVFQTLHGQDQLSRDWSRKQRKRKNGASPTLLGQLQQQLSQDLAGDPKHIYKHKI